MFFWIKKIPSWEFYSHIILDMVPKKFVFQLFFKKIGEIMTSMSNLKHLYRLYGKNVRDKNCSTSPGFSFAPTPMKQKGKLSILTTKISTSLKMQFWSSFINFFLRFLSIVGRYLTGKNVYRPKTMFV